VNRIYVLWSHLSRRLASSIEISHSDDHGRTWSGPTKVSRAGDDLIYANVAISRNGTVYVTWTDSSSYTVRIARSTDGGEHFGPDQPVAAFSVVPIPHCGIGIVIRADPRSCIQANPIVSVDTSGGRTRTKAFFSCAVSRNGGSTWTRPVRVASAASDETQPGARQYGYYQGLAVANGVAHPIWTDTRRLAERQEEIYTTRVTRADLARGG